MDTPFLILLDIPKMFHDVNCYMFHVKHSMFELKNINIYKNEIAQKLINVSRETCSNEK